MSKMNPKFFFAIVLSAAAAIPMTSNAQARSGLYVGVGGGYNQLSTEGVTHVGTPFGKDIGGEIKFDGGLAALGSVGWGFSNGLRLELEGSYRKNKLSEASAASLRNAPGNGSESKSAVFLNALYDFDKTSLGISPYVGLGIGRARIKWDDAGAANSSLTARLNDTQGKLAYQAIAGISFLENLVPGMSFTAEYRYMGVSGSRVHEGTVTPARGPGFPITMPIESSRNHSFMLGLRYQFDAGRK